MRFYRRRLGLTQKELAYLLGYDSDSHISRIENGSRNPNLAEVLVIELVFGVPGVAIFPEVREVVGQRVRRRLRRLTNELGGTESVNPRVAYKTAQLERVLGSLLSEDGFDLDEEELWHTKVA